MKIIAIGGSNTLVKGGYMTVLSDAIKKRYPKKEVVNLGIGDTNSSMGLYRLLAYGQATKGDLIIWEYALNDRFGLEHRGENWYLRNLEYVLRYAIEYKCGVLPIIMATQADDKAVVPISYRAKIHALCDAYGVKPFDVANRAREEFGLKHLLPEDYKDPHHYTLNGRVVEMVANHVIDVAKRQARPPMDVVPIYARPGYRAAIHTNFIAEPMRQFTSSILDLPYHDMRDGEVVFRPEVEGQFLSLIVLTSPGAGKCQIEFGKNKKIPALMSPRVPSESRTLLRAIMGEHHRADMPLKDGDVLKITVPQAPENDPGKPRGIVAVVTEEPIV